jgi:hypothetical protein
MRAGTATPPPPVIAATEVGGAVLGHAPGRDPGPAFDTGDPGRPFDDEIPFAWAAVALPWALTLLGIGCVDRL